MVPELPDDGNPDGPAGSWMRRRRVAWEADALPLKARSVTLPARPAPVTVNLSEVVMVVVDMQNDFCSPGGWADASGADYERNRMPIAPLSRLLPQARANGVPVFWLNWGNRPDLLNVPVRQIHHFVTAGKGIGLGGRASGKSSAVLEKGSWGAAVVADLVQHPTDIKVDKYRLSGFWDTPLDSMLRNLDAKVILFAGVNIDQCVLFTLADACFLGYCCVLLEDCCATTSPGFCSEAARWNVERCLGFIANSGDLLHQLSL